MFAEIRSRSSTAHGSGHLQGHVAIPEGVEEASDSGPEVSADEFIPAPQIPADDPHENQDSLHLITEQDGDSLLVEQLEDGLDDIQDIILPLASPAAPSPAFFTRLGDIRGHFIPPPSSDTVDSCIKDLDTLLHPKRKAGRGHKDHGLDGVLSSRLELMLMFLRLYAENGYAKWSACALQISRCAGRGSWLARRLRQWCQEFARDRTKLPTHRYGKWNSSVLEDEDLAQEIHLHLQGLGPYVSAKDIVKHLSSPEMKERLNLKKAISERTARRWMHRMRYRWRAEPKGQYKDGHEREDVVTYRQEEFLPRMEELEAMMSDWSSGSDTQRSPASFILWTHDESTFYANDRRKIRWVHADEAAKPYAKGEGASLMVADFISADFGWLKATSG